MPYTHTFGNRTWTFSDLKSLLAKASPARSGDQLAGIAAENDEERMMARMALAEVPLKRFLEEALVPYESDEVTRLIFDSHDKNAFVEISHLTVGGFRNWWLNNTADTEMLTRIAPAVTPEMAAAVSKLKMKVVYIAATSSAKMPRRDALPQHHRSQRAHVCASAAEPSDGRRKGHRRLNARRPALWLRRRGHRHQPCQ